MLPTSRTRHHDKWKGSQRSRTVAFHVSNKQDFRRGLNRMSHVRVKAMNIPNFVKLWLNPPRELPVTPTWFLTPDTCPRLYELLSCLTSLSAALKKSHVPLLLVQSIKMVERSSGNTAGSENGDKRLDFITPVTASASTA